MAVGAAVVTGAVVAVGAAVVTATAVAGGAPVERGAGCQPPWTTTRGGDAIAEAEAVAALAVPVAVDTGFVAVTAAVVGGLSGGAVVAVAAVAVPALLCEAGGVSLLPEDTARKMAPAAATRPTGTSHNGRRRRSGATASETDVGDAPVASTLAEAACCRARAAPDWVRIEPYYPVCMTMPPLALIGSRPLFGSSV